MFCHIRPHTCPAERHSWGTQKCTGLGYTTELMMLEMIHRQLQTLTPLTFRRFSHSHHFQPNPHPLLITIPMTNHSSARSLPLCMQTVKLSVTRQDGVLPGRRYHVASQHSKGQVIWTLASEDQHVSFLVNVLAFLTFTWMSLCMHIVYESI